MTDIVERLRSRHDIGLHHILTEAADEIERLRTELAICRDAIEVCYNVADNFPTDDDGDDAVRRVTMRRLNEAVGKAAPRLLVEHPEGQRFFGLHFRELREENERLRAERDNFYMQYRMKCDAETKRQAVEIERLRAALSQQRGEPVAWMVTNTDGADAYVTSDPATAQKGQRALPLYTGPVMDTCADVRSSSPTSGGGFSSRHVAAVPQCEPVATLHRHPSIGILRVTFEDAVTELVDGTYPLYAAPQVR